MPFLAVVVLFSIIIPAFLLHDFNSLGSSFNGQSLFIGAQYVLQGV